MGIVLVLCGMLVQVIDYNNERKRQRVEKKKSKKE
jgi:hypothetical protein